MSDVNEPSVFSPHGHFERLLLNAFRAAGWKAEVGPSVGRHSADVVAGMDDYRYVVEMKVASEGRRDRLVALLSQAILQARLHANGVAGAAPLAVIAAPRIPAGVAEALREFAREHAPGVAVGLLDRQGLRSFLGPGLESLNAESIPADIEPASADRGIDLFSDLNQWMLKALLAPHIERAELMPASLPRAECRNASALAKAARVSVMSSFRLLRQLAREGFVHESRDRVGLVRIDALLRRWQAANQKPAPELNVRWVLAGATRQLPRAVERLGPRACVGLFSAARAMGLGHVQSAYAHIYVNNFGSASLQEAGLMKAEPGDRVDVVLRLPAVRESVFRGIVYIDGLPVSDVLQTWLDVSSHPARGKEQADVIYQRVIKPMIDHSDASVR